MRAALLLALPLLAGCPAEIGIQGNDLSRLFPATQDWYWRYNNAGTADVSYWYRPAGEAGLFRIWIGDEQDILEDIDAGGDGWRLEIDFTERDDGWYLTGWRSNDDSDPVGSVQLDFDGVPFALKDSYTNETRTVQLGTVAWSTTSVRRSETLELNGQVIDDYWTLDVATDAGDQPLEGTWDMATGLILRWDLQGLAPDGGEPWRHLHNDAWSNVLGTR